MGSWAKEFYDTGELMREGTIERDQYNGTVTTYYPNGKIRSKVNYKDGVMDDPNWREFYDTGELWNLVAIAHGKKQGPAKEYYPDGVMKNEGTFKDNKREGPFKVYTPEGVLKAVDTYRHDWLSVHQEYNDKGRITMEQKYYEPL